MEPIKDMIAWYRFDDPENLGKDYSGHGRDAKPCGDNAPIIKDMDGRMALHIEGEGVRRRSYMELPENILQEVTDEDGMCITFWLNLSKGYNVWERIFDFGKDHLGPYLFLTRNLRASCFSGADLIADPGQFFPVHIWRHVALVIHGTKYGTESSAGPVIYIDGEMVADGSISQTSSGNYKRLREWFAGLQVEGNYVNNYIGFSQFEADPDVHASLMDFRIYKRTLSEDEIINIVCETISEHDVINIVFDKYLTPPDKIVTQNIDLPTSFMGGKVSVSWKSEKEHVLSSDGKVGDFEKPEYIRMDVTVSMGEESRSESYYVNVVPKITTPYTMTIHTGRETVDVSDTLYGLFFEDINNSADGGLYAELVNNRSFEAFEYNTYDAFSGVDGKSTGRNHTPLKYWFGDLYKVSPQNRGGLNEYLGITKPDTSEYYISVADGAVLYNRGFCDEHATLSMYLHAGERYDFSIWAKLGRGVTEAEIIVELVDGADQSVSSAVLLSITESEWKKYGKEEKLVLVATKTGYAQLKMSFHGNVAIDMVSLMPRNVWGAKEEATSKTAHANYLGNPNYRLRRDMVIAMRDLHPTFLRFPGGCISEGSYIWENVYDWKDSVDDIEYRKENYNVWGYMMTMGLGYMEYFQLAEDLNATPLPVMACGVLCQARSDYANPAGGALQEKYIQNFIDLIDFAISVDFKHNEWAKLRKKMGHEAPFDLHYLGVGNENWGEKFFASFEAFKYAIDQHMKQYYPNYKLTIISTVGAQADDDAYKYGWQFLSGNLKTEGAVVSFTDGEKSFEKEVTWYEHEKNYMETIADEHYYRSNQYLFENVDRYNYYYRAYHEDGTLNEEETSKVFVGEYASSDKNTLAGAIAEAALMTGFERNADVVRLAATAPLFNKVRLDGSYRWTPDAIWFDNDSVWLTPNYYVQQMFAKYIGKKVVETSFTSYAKGNQVLTEPYGGIEIATGNAELLVKEAKVISNQDKSVLFYQDFTKELAPEWEVLPGAQGYIQEKGKGLTLPACATGLNGIYIMNKSWSNYTFIVKVQRVNGFGGFYIGTGLTEVLEPEKKDVLEYAVGMDNTVTGLRVLKQGVEGYRLGDYSSSLVTGNMRECNYEEIEDNVLYTVTVDFGGEDGKHIHCYYTDNEDFHSKTLDYKLEAYNRAIYHAVTKDEEHLYAKFVNPSEVPKKLEVTIEDYKQVGTAKMIVLTAEPELVHMANVNTKGKELVRPKEYMIAVNDQKAQILLPENSVCIVVF